MHHQARMYSSVVEQQPYKLSVAGSNPATCNAVLKTAPKLGGVSGTRPHRIRNREERE